MSGDADVATMPLGGVKPFIRQLNHCLDAEERNSGFRDPDADGRRDRLFFSVEGIVRDGPAQAVRKRGRIRHRRIRHQDAEFIAAGTCHQIRCALAVFEDAGDVQDGAVTDVMTEGVIYPFEAIDIDNGDAERRMIALEAIPLRKRPREEIAPVGQPRERIGVRQLPEVVGMLNEIRDVSMSQHAATARKRCHLRADYAAVARANIDGLAVATIHRLKAAQHVAGKLIGRKVVSTSGGNIIDKLGERRSPRAMLVAQPPHGPCLGVGKANAHRAVDYDDALVDVLHCFAQQREVMLRRLF